MTSRLQLSLFACVLFVAGCVGDSAPMIAGNSDQARGGASSFEPRPIDRGTQSAPIDPVLLEAYLDIGRLHVERPDYAELTIAGLVGLEELAPGLSIDPTSEQIAIFGPTGAGNTLPLPPNDSPNLWALAATAGIQAAREADTDLAEATMAEVYEAFFDAATDTLDDFSRYLTAEEARSERAFRVGYGGIGVIIDTADEGGALVVDVFREGPAFAAGVQAGWRITSVNGTSIVGLDLNAISERLRGNPGTRVTVGFVTGGATRSATLRRERVIPNYVVGRLEPGNIGVIELSGFNASTTDNMMDEVAGLTARAGGRLNGLVLDVRGNPGGVLSVAKEVTDMFLTDGSIVYTRGRDPMNADYYGADSASVADGVPMAVLIDGYSASAAEILAGALQDRERAVVIGSTSYGKGSVQTVEDLPDRTELYITSSRYFVPSGITIDGQGVLPTICTANGATSAEGVISAFRAGALPSPRGMEALRRRAPEDEAALAQVRAACEWEGPSDDGDDLDLDVAVRFLTDGQLYQAALTTQRVTLAFR